MGCVHSTPAEASHHDYRRRDTIRNLEEHVIALSERVACGASQNSLRTNVLHRVVLAFLPRGDRSPAQSNCQWPAKESIAAS